MVPDLGTPVIGEDAEVAASLGWLTLLSWTNTLELWRFVLFCCPVRGEKQAAGHVRLPDQAEIILLLLFARH